MTEATRQMAHYHPNLTVKDTKRRRRTPSGICNSGEGKGFMKEECLGRFMPASRGCRVFETMKKYDEDTCGVGLENDILLVDASSSIEESTGVVKELHHPIASYFLSIDDCVTFNDSSSRRLRYHSNDSSKVQTMSNDDKQNENDNDSKTDECASMDNSKVRREFLSAAKEFQVEEIAQLKFEEEVTYE